MESERESYLRKVERRLEEEIGRERKLKRQRGKKRLNEQER